MCESSSLRTLAGQPAAVRRAATAAAPRQDAAGIATVDGRSFRMHKGNGLARDVFRTRNMRSLPACRASRRSATDPGLGEQFRGGAAVLRQRAVGIVLAHNGNLTNWETLKRSCSASTGATSTPTPTPSAAQRAAHELQLASEGLSLDPAAIFRAVAGVHRGARLLRGGAEIAGYGCSASATRSASGRSSSASTRPTPAPST